MQKGFQKALVVMVVFGLAFSLLMSSARAPGHWNVVLTASPDGYSDVSDFGVIPDATDCFDPAYDELDPPEPPTGVVSYFWHPDCASTPVDQRKLATSKIAPAPMMTWTYKVKPVAIGGTMCISWSAGDIASIPLELPVYLHCPDGSVVNMRMATAYCFEAAEGTTYTFTIHVGGWNVVLTASKEGYSDVCDFGARKDATDCFDPAYDELDPPAPPTGVVSYFWHPDCASTPVDQRKLATSKIALAPLMTWTYKVKPVAIGGTMCIRWSAGDIASIPLELGVYLHCPDGSVVNMRMATEHCFEAEAGTTYTFTIGVGGCVFELPLSAGWNMVSFPCLPDDPSFSNILGGVDFYQVLTWDGTSYVSPSTAEAGQGYWVLVLADTTVTVANGVPVESYERRFCGWTMIGSIITCTVDADCVFPDYYQLYTWAGTSYVRTALIEPGKGYWALVLTCTSIVVGDSCCVP